MINIHDPHVLSEALPLWLGYGVYAIPKRSLKRLEARYGRDDAAALVPVLQQLVHEFWENDPANWTDDPVQVRDSLIQQFRARHPELSDEVLQTLYWHYSWNSR